MTDHKVGEADLRETTRNRNYSIYYETKQLEGFRSLRTRHVHHRRKVWKKGDQRVVHTPVLEKRLVQTPVLHLAVIDILSWGQEGEIVELAEKVVLPGQEDCLRHSGGDRISILKPRDIDHWWGELVHKADKDVGLSQLHRAVWEHSHLWRYWGHATEISFPAQASSPSHQSRKSIWNRAPRIYAPSQIPISDTLACDLEPVLRCKTQEPHSWLPKHRFRAMTLWVTVDGRDKTWDIKERTNSWSTWTHTNWSLAHARISPWEGKSITIL